jgi:hypothetical protein
MLIESGLSFLGFGVQPPAGLLGSLLPQGTVYLTTAPWLALGPGLMLALCIGSVQLLGDTLRDALDPLRARPEMTARIEVQRPPHLVWLGDGVSARSMVSALTSPLVESLGIVGESGSGKTTVGMAIGKLLPANARFDGGDIVVEGQSVLEAARSSCAHCAATSWDSCSRTR